MAKTGTKVKRIKANDSEAKKEVKETKKAENSSKKPKISKYTAKVAGVEFKEKKVKRKLPKALAIIIKPLSIIFKPFAGVGRYLRDSWKELKLVRWPNRRETWKMTGAVIAFSLFFAGLVLALDGIFNWAFTTIIK